MPNRPRRYSALPPGAKRQAARSQERWRGSARDRGYDRDWEKLRAAKLHADPLCEHCKARGHTTAAEEVDHIKRFRRPDGSIDDELRRAWWNLQSLCKPCHSAKTAREDGAFGRPPRG